VRLELHFFSIIGRRMDKSLKIKAQLIKFAFCISIIAILVVLDQLTKAWAINALQGKEDIVIWEGVFQLHYLENRGIAFGLFQGKQWIFAIFTVFILILIAFVLGKMKMTKRFIPAFVVIILLSAGAIGNLIDRVALNYVVDFLYFSLIDFPIFNVADCYVTVSCFLIFVLLFIYKEEELLEILPVRLEKKQENKEEEKK